jgi:LysR family glycine cleavage system transcriptional activator
VRPFREAFEAPFAYWIVCPKSVADLPKISLFRNWLLQEAKNDARRVAQVGTPRHKPAD